MRRRPSTSQREGECPPTADALAPERVEITRWVRGSEGWMSSVLTDPAGSIEVLGEVLPAAEIYARRLT